ncbi:MAG: GAF domain-containing protein [Deltaproteobacteria bacterium]|nr:MAG: GAF domain-containing protein [Deltaproteobacteria bacterium]
MISVKLVALVTLGYLGLLFLVAYYADRKHEQGKSLISNPTIYSLSLAVYCTSWTFYGSVGRAATIGLDFLTIYLGPTLIAFAWWFLLRRMVRISKEQNITTIADFVSSRYGKSAYMGGLVTIFSVVGIMPYIALQLKAVSQTFDLLTLPPPQRSEGLGHYLPQLPQTLDTAFIIALTLALFGVLFGARNLDASERHEGMVAAIALESIIKLVAFLAVGLFVTYGLFDGFTDIFGQFLHDFPERIHLLLIDTEQIPYITWFSLTFISMMAFMFLPRQFHIMVIENSDESHIRQAMWRFPLYAFAINLFVLPVALGGLLLNGGDTSQADYFVLSLPMQTGHYWLGMFAFVGGLSAAAGMVMISSVALATMVLNQLITPLILKFRIVVDNYYLILLNLKRLAIFVVVFLGYLFYRAIGESYALVNMGLISFIAATQFAPGLIGGLYWRRATRKGAATGLILGFLVWFYTLIIPSFVRSGWLHSAILEEGLFGIRLLRPLELFGLSGFDIWSHSLFWTLFFNIGAFLTLSLLTAPDEREREQAEKFVGVYTGSLLPKERQRISRAPSILEFVDLMSKFIGEKQAHAAIADYLGDREATIDQHGSLSEYELPNLKRFTERTLAGSVGAAAASIIVENYLSTRGSRMEKVFDIFGSVTLSRTSSREQLSVLYEAARVVASGAPLQTIFDNILELLIQQFKFDLVVIRLLDQDSMTLTVRSQKGMSSEHFGHSARKLTMETTIGEVFLTNQAIVVNDTDELKDKPQTSQIVHREGILSFAHAPITMEGEPIGVLSAFSKSVRGIFTEEFVELFTSLASQVGVAWRNNQQTRDLIAAREQQKEMEIAKTIQLSLLPQATPRIEGISLAGLCVPAREVGGDYYDYLERADGNLDLVVADVSGHNVGSALIMAETRTFIRARASKLDAPDQVLDALNRFFYDDLTQAELFITLVYIRFQPETGNLVYASAGHNPPLVYRHASGTIDRLDAEGLILGVRPEVTFDCCRDRLEPGDVLLMFTDGLTEAENRAGEFFGEERLVQMLIDNRHLQPQELIETLLQQLRLFTGSQNFRDDISLVVMKRES